MGHSQVIDYLSLPLLFSLPNNAPHFDLQASFFVHHPIRRSSHLKIVALHPSVACDIDMEHKALVQRKRAGLALEVIAAIGEMDEANLSDESKEITAQTQSKTKTAVNDPSIDQGTQSCPLQKDKSDDLKPLCSQMPASACVVDGYFLGSHVTASQTCPRVVTGSLGEPSVLGVLLA